MRLAPRSISTPGARLVCAGCLLAACTGEPTSAQEAPRTGHEPARLALQGISGGPSTRIAISPDGRFLVTLGASEATGIWDLRRGEVLHSLVVGAGGGTAVTFSAGGERLAIGTLAGEVQLWDLRSGALVRRFRGPTRRVHAVVFSPDGALLVAGMGDQPETGPQAYLTFVRLPGEVLIWEVATGRRRLRLEGHTGDVNDVEFSPDGRRLVSAGQDMAVVFWDASTGRLLHRREEHDREVTSLAFSPDGRVLASGGRDGRLMVRGGEDGRLRHTLTMPPHGSVEQLSFVRGQTLVAFRGSAVRFGGEPPVGVHLFDAATWQERHAFPHLPARAVSQDGALLAAAEDSSISIWDAATGPLRQSLPDADRDVVNTLAFSPDGRLLITGGSVNRVGSSNGARAYAGQLRVWDLRAARVASTAGDLPHPISILARSRNGEQLATNGGSGRSDDEQVTVHLWRCTVSGGQLHHERTLVGERGAATSVSFSPDGRLVACGSTSGIDGPGATYVWETASGRLQRSFPSGKSGLDDLEEATFSPEGRLLAILGDEAVRLVETRTWTHRRTLKLRMGSVPLLAFHPDGRRLVAHEHPKAVLWDVRSGRRVQDLPAPDSWGGARDWSPDGRRLALGTRLGTVEVWNVPAPPGRPRRWRRLAGHDGFVTAVAWSPDGRTLASSGMDGAVNLWDGRSGRLRATLRVLSGGTPIVYTPEGYYAGPPEAARFIRWRVGTDLFPAEAFASRFHRPEIVAKALMEEVAR